MSSLATTKSKDFNTGTWPLCTSFRQVASIALITPLVVGCQGTSVHSSSDQTAVSSQSVAQSSSTSTSSNAEPVSSSASEQSSSEHLQISSSAPLQPLTIVPDDSWHCGAPQGIPLPSQGTLVFSADLTVNGRLDIGDTPYGKRQVLTIGGGSLSGERLQGQFETGGLDLALELSNGATELEQINILRMQDGTAIYLHNCGFAQTGAEATRFIADFEAPSNSPYAWLNQGDYAGLRVYDTDNGNIRLDIYDISDVTLSDNTLQLQDPTGIPNQPSDCSTLTGNRGSEVFRENVSLGNSIGIGQSKYGNRNIIPITGGTVSGGINGVVVPGGADYQLIGAQTVLDARYMLETDDGEYILVRNCGAFGALIPQFETRKAGPYNYLNEGDYLSSDPNVGGGGVSITFYERQ